MDQIVVLPGLHRLHKRLGDADGDIEIGDLTGIVFALDELQNIRMIHPQNPHIGAAARTALLDRLGGGVEYPHKGYGAGGNAAGGIHGSPLGAKA